MSLIAPPDLDWANIASREMDRWRDALEELEDIHHIGSTSVAGLPAKPIIDILPVFASAGAMDSAREAVEAMAYEWMGEFGLAGRRYCRMSDAKSGQRLFHCHAYASGNPGVARHLAFRDALRGNASLRAAYTSVKAACAARHPDGGTDYGVCKSAWIDKAERRALERLK